MAGINSTIRIFSNIQATKLKCGGGNNTELSSKIAQARISFKRMKRVQRSLMSLPT